MTNDHGNINHKNENRINGSTNSTINNKMIDIRIVPIASSHMKSIHKIIVESFGTKRFLCVAPPAMGSYNDLYQHYESMSDMKKQLGAVAVMANPDSNNQNDISIDNTSHQVDPKHSNNNNNNVDNDDVVVGYVQMTMDGLTMFLDGFHKCATDEMYIEMIAVSSNARGCGIGQKLLNWCQLQSIRCIKNVLRLEVLSGNRAIGLYERYGFIICQQKTDCISGCALCIFFGRPYGLCNRGWGSIMMEMNLHNSM